MVFRRDQTTKIQARSLSLRKDLVACALLAWSILLLLMLANSSLAQAQPFPHDDPCRTIFAALRSDDPQVRREIGSNPIDDQSVERRAFPIRAAQWVARKQREYWSEVFPRETRVQRYTYDPYNQTYLRDPASASADDIVVEETGRRFNWPRIFVRPRDQNQQMSRSHRWLVEFPMNPIATAFNRPRQLTIPASMLAMYLLIDLPTDTMEARQRERAVESAAARVASGNVPGASYIFRLIRNGFVDRDEGLRLINTQEQTLLRWFSGTSQTLPRVEEMVRLGLLTRPERDTFYNLLRNIGTETGEAVRDVTGLVDPPSQEAALRLLTELKALSPNARAERVRAILRQQNRLESTTEAQFTQLMANITLTMGPPGGRPTLSADQLLVEVLARGLNRPNSGFSHYSTQQRNHLATAFFPLPKHEGVSDLELHYRLSIAPNRSPAVENIFSLARGQRIEGTNVTLRIDATDAILMTYQATENPRGIEDRLRQMREIIPNQQVPESFRRPEIPTYSVSRTFDGQEIRGENARWRLIYRDPRFAHIRSAFEATQAQTLIPDGTPSEENARLRTESRHRAVIGNYRSLAQVELEMGLWQELLELPRQQTVPSPLSGTNPAATPGASPTAISPEAVLRILRLNGPAQTPNPLLQSTRDQALARLENYQQSTADSREVQTQRTTTCLTGVVGFWADIAHEESDWIRANANGNLEAFRATRIPLRQQRLRGILDACGPAN